MLMATKLAGIRQIDVMVGCLVSSLNLSWIVSFSGGVDVFIPPPIISRPVQRLCFYCHLPNLCLGIVPYFLLCSISSFHMIK